MTKLQILTEAAIQSLSSIPYIRENGMTEYTLKQGSALAFKILRKPEIAIADSILTKGTIFPYHKHEGCRELLIVYKGEVTILSDGIDGCRKSLSAGDYHFINCSDGHALLAKEDSWIIAITMPADKDFPK